MDAPDPAPPRLPSWRWPSLVAALVLLLGAAGLGEQGLLTEIELDAWDRARASTGVELDDLVRHPWLPERMRALTFARFGPELGLRLPGLLATSLTAGLVTWLGLYTLGSLALALLAAGFYAAFLGVGANARFAGGGAELEACVTLCIVAVTLVASPRVRAPFRVLAGLVAGLALLGGTASGGILLGGALPCFILAASRPQLGSTRLAQVGLLAGTGALVAGAWLIQGQGEGYIPLLGAAKDLALADNPLRREITASVEAFGRQVFPFAILVPLGMVLGRGCTLASRWIALGLVALTGWSAVYGPAGVSLMAPAALVCAGAVEALVDIRRPAPMRRIALMLVVGGIWVAAKDAGRTPSRVAMPLHRFVREGSYPAEAIGAVEVLGDLATYAWVALVLAYLLAELVPRAGTGSRPGAVPGREPVTFALAAFALALAHQAWVSLEALPRATATQLSPREFLAGYDRAAEAGTLPRPLALHRIRERGLELYGPPPETREKLSNRRALRDWLAEDEPRVAMIRASDYAGLFALQRKEGWPLHLLADPHHDYELVSNFNPPGLELRRPLDGILVEQLPTLEHETFVRFDQHLEVVGWQIDGELARGSEVTVTLALRVLRPLSAGAKIYVRLQQGRMSKINLEPHKPAQGRYPANHWRRDDLIVDRVTFEIPRVNTIPGPHELFIGVQRNKKKNLEITAPEGREGDFGVTLRGRQAREFANLGVVEIE